MTEEQLAAARAYLTAANNDSDAAANWAYSCGDKLLLEIARLRKALTVAHTYAESYRGYPTGYSQNVEFFTDCVLRG